MRKIILLASAVLFFNLNSQADTITALTSGNWNSNSTWSCHCSPTNADNIVIPSGIQVTSSRPLVLSPGPEITISISGTLVLSNGSLQIDANDVVHLHPGGRITGAGHLGGAVYSGIVPIFVESGSTISGPTKITDGVLPIALLFFRGEGKENGVLLEWAANTEINFNTYVLMRSGDGIYFEAIAETPIAGNSTTRSDYSFYDADPLPGYGYYCLQAVDKEGYFGAFPMIRVSGSMPLPQPVKKRTGKKLK